MKRLDFFYEKIAEAICRSPKMKIQDLLIMQALLKYGSLDDVKILLERMMEHGWLYKTPLFSLEGVPELEKFSIEKDYFLYGFTALGRERFKDVIEDVEAGYKLYYSYSRGGIFRIGTDNNIMKINRNTPIYEALSLFYDTGVNTVNLRDIVEKHKEYDSTSNITKIIKSFNNFRPRFIEALKKEGLEIQNDEQECFSIRQDFVVIPPYLKIKE